MINFTDLTSPLNYQMNATKTKVQLKLAINRLKLLQQKYTSLNLVARQEIAQLLRIGKIDSARIRVELVIRQDLMVEALELLELYAETLHARFPLLESMRNCDPCLVESVNSVIYGAPRVDIPELLQVSINSKSRSEISLYINLVRNSGRLQWII
jgi:vacuolar protein sorting-associated protein IST1